MVRFPGIRFVLLVLAILISSSTFALAGDAYFENAAGAFVEGVRCGAPIPTYEQTEQVAREVDEWLRAGGHVANKAGDVTIPIAMHVVAHDDGFGDVSDAAIADQMQILNAAYAGTGFAFSLASTDRTYDTDWSTHRYGDRDMKAMKETLAIDPASTFNVYICDIGGGLLGYATFPDMYAEDDWMHGVVCLYSSLPGGTAAPYNEGDTLTHEAGHFLGLYHTFQGGCVVPGDYVDDTPYEGSAAYGCPEGRDTCTGGDVDPIHNFMDYTDDYCMYLFTADQSVRMNQQMALYRPTMYGATTVPGPTAAFVGTPTSGDYPLAVQFTDQSTGSPTSWSWTFGDGATATAQSPSHTYTAAGSYTVSLTAANVDGTDTATKTGYITVTEPGTGGTTMFVSDMNVYKVSSGRKYYGRCDVTISDGTAGVAGATVTATYSGDISGTASGVTGTDGQVTLSTSKKAFANSAFCFTVTNVTHATLTYDSGANLVTQSCETGDVYRDGQLVLPMMSLQNSPNPFNPMTVIEFSVVKAGQATIKIYDARGHLVATPVDGFVGTGRQTVTWDARDRSSGIYFYQLTSDGKVETQKMVLLK